ncbi:PAS domain S-box protein [Dongia sp.]|uniref:PAS domain-containing protein n=1 Tax=Dongia sp. TaxID=1977262 RepID=UPI0035B0DFF8
MGTAIHSADQHEAVPPDTVAFLAELARLPMVQQGDFDGVAELVSRRCRGLVDARFITVWLLNAERTMLQSVARFDLRSGQPCPQVDIPAEHMVKELAELQQATQIVSNNALADERLIAMDDGYLRQFGITSLLEHVIRASGADIGLLRFERTEKTAQPWQPADMALARGLCSYLALAAVNRQKTLLEQKSASTAALQAAILENAAYAVIATDTDGTITFFNRAAEQMLGYRSAELVHKATPAIFHDPVEIADRAIQFSNELKRTVEPGFGVFTAKTLAGERNEDEWTFIRRDGTRATVVLSITAIRDRNGAITGFLGIASDVTERNAVSSRLRQSEEMLSRVLLQSPDAILITALKDGSILDANPGFEQITGRKRAEAVGRTTVDLSLWADLNERDAMLAQVRETGEVKSMPIRILRRGREIRHCVLWGRTFEYNGVRALLTVVHDITEQLRGEEQLRASEEKLRSLFALSPLGINLQDMDGHYIEANEAFLGIVGYDRDELLRMTCYDLMPKEYLTDEPHRLQRLRETGIIPAYEKSYYRKDGSLVPVSTATVLVSGPDGRDFKWTIVEDITARRQAEESQRRLNDELEHLVEERTRELQSAIEGLMRAEKLASLGSLVAGVAHEISTPVGNASLATSTLSGAVKEFEGLLETKLTRSGLDGFVRQVKLGVDIANRNIERVASLIQSFKQVAVDQTSSQRRQFQLTEVVDEILTTMHPSLKRAGVVTEMSIDPDLALDSYPGPLGQVLTNLINNALIHAFGKERADSTAPHRIDIKASALDARTLRLDVADNGAGMEAGVLGRIFDPFFTSRLGQGGSGLGLHIVHNIVVDILAGSITVASELDRGTTFSITMPLKTPAACHTRAAS